MTTDIKIRWDLDLLEGDFLFENNDFVTDEGLGTAVLISWFTDQRATDADLLDEVSGSGDEIDKRGWWGDLVDPIVVGDQIGSKLWLLERSKTTQENLTLAEERGELALEWMKEDGIAKEIAVTATKIKKGAGYVLALVAKIKKANGNEVNISFDPEWFVTLSDDYT
jgi:phage gp46-like protein